MKRTAENTFAGSNVDFLRIRQHAVDVASKSISIRAFAGD